MNNIILLLLAGIGDALLFVPTITNLRKMYPKANITALVIYSAVKDILDNNKDLNEVIFFDFLKQGRLKSLSFVLRLRKNNYDLSILAFPANRFQHNLISFLIGANTRLGHLYEVKRITSLSFLHTARIPLEHHCHHIDSNLKFLEHLGADPTTFTKKISFPITNKDRLAADQFLKQHHITKHDLLIGMHPGSSELSGMLNKRWPKERFAEIGDLLSERHHAKILLFGGKNEKKLKQHISSLMKHKPIFVDDYTLSQNSALVQRCKGFITNDTLLMHLASIFNVPTIAISAHINPYRTRPFHKKSILLTPPAICQPYYVGKNLVCRYAGTPRYCLNAVTTQQVYDAFVTLAL